MARDLARYFQRFNRLEVYAATANLLESQHYVNKLWLSRALRFASMPNKLLNIATTPRNHMHLQLRACAFIITALLATNASAKEFSGVSGKYSYRCQAGENITVSGTSQQLQLSGPCAALIVDAVSATIAIQQVERIDVAGTNNNIRFGSTAQGGKPSVQSTGFANTINADASLRSKNAPIAAESPELAAPSNAPAAAMITSVDQCQATQTIEGVSNGQAIACSAGARLLFSGVNIKASVSGNCSAICIDGVSNQISVSGNALAIAISGTSNVISAARVDAVHIEGMSNTVNYRSSAVQKGPKFSNDGINNALRLNK
jgi:hypothetical protein